ncbi:MAG: hypothetical protein GY778_08015 [bacterium]|nr:hypothetical protein [bacterium]
MTKYTATILLAGCGFLALPVALARAEHHADVWVGRSAAGQLNISPVGFVPEDHFAYLLPSSGLLNGWVDNDPGFDGLADPDPPNDIFPLEPGTEVWLELIAVDPAFRLIDAATAEIIDLPGEATELGGHTLHVHNFWHINSDDPAFDPQQCIWHASFFLRDEGSTSYASSEALDFAFTNVPPEDWDGDFDDDSDVDLTDHEALNECLFGPDQVPAPDDPAITTCPIECLNGFDFDDDRDVDLEDYAEMQRVFTG